VIESTWVIEHTRTKEFEKKLADYIGSKYAVATVNGTIAISLALMALDIGVGDEVITTDFSFIGTTNAIWLTGACPIFADIKTSNFGIDPKEIEKKITPETKAILPVHMNGRPCDIDEILDVADDHDLAVVEDAAQTLSSRLRGKHLGTFGDVGCFSFSTTKIITTGQGGLLVTDNEDTYEKIQRLKDHGRFDRAQMKTPRDHYPTIGYNFKFTDLQAAVGLAQLKKLDQRVKTIRRMYVYYRSWLGDYVDFIETSSETTPWCIDIMLKNAGDNVKLREHLRQHNIGSRLFDKPLHSQPCYHNPAEAADFPNTKYITDRGLWLPSSTFLSSYDIDRVIDEVIMFFRRGL